jgi:tRNA A-37 threonylcarbamoyl transferase component Bud32
MSCASIDSSLPITGNATTATGFDGWWQLRGEAVEPPNLRRHGESGVERINLSGEVFYLKRQVNHLCRSLRHPAGYPTAVREYEALQALARIGIKVPEVVYSGARKTRQGWQAVLVTRELAAFYPLDTWYAQGGRLHLGEVMHQQLLHRIGYVLGKMHRHHWQHTSLYPKHIFLTEGQAGELPMVALLDLEKARRRLLVRQAAQRDLAQLHRRCGGFWSPSDWQRLLDGHQAGLAGD